MARIGGDEFVVFMTNIQKNSVIEAKVNAIRNIFDHYTNGENTCSIGCSIGEMCIRDSLCIPCGRYTLYLCGV